MLSNVFLGLSLLGAEWVLYLLLILSVVSVALMIERWRFYRDATKGLVAFREKIRAVASDRKWDLALKTVQERNKGKSPAMPDLESGLVGALVEHAQESGTKASSEVLNELASDEVLRTKLSWERNLSYLATIGSNSPFIGLFGTVLGIIKAFHDLSKTAGAGAQTVTAGISEALVATAVGILVAIPAIAAYNIFQRRVKVAVTEAEAMKSFLIGKIVKE